MVSCIRATCVQRVRVSELEGPPAHMTAHFSDLVLAEQIVACVSHLREFSSQAVSPLLSLLDLAVCACAGASASAHRKWIGERRKAVPRGGNSDRSRLASRRGIWLIIRSGVCCDKCLERLDVIECMRLCEADSFTAMLTCAGCEPQRRELRAAARLPATSSRAPLGGA